ncbi:DNA mismatch repair protein MutT [Sulfolobus sp. A20]|uniref:NUDIX hydrolase n=1 Tax=Sulfolobaceae TaxID=118883 RepID=UPI0008460E46|nr:MULTISPECIES: NUDIX hydrolase [unclassified Sulfolobus]TRM76677.1 NUDIX domain-containing protein [Sulfolobus sp. E5]TRM77911.1 NUDIX domain-containing protein [Sulfolobus sp. B5]TRM77951.1 NUDIX domain-containing protein [Sulfolobus sp. A20-N-F8]TRM81076.1 NUDIX domain-containing protein [Sulfolobus sp. A20-N-F6]TRM85122.1 NUDIX domain-containing protein [Sulfolobus sp. F3]TRM86014.1 NUDIX domain-containing protein [Sulfolobus sp. E3]TRM87934.1 NUDIX domain-containing protein [Sulfolobus
MDRPIVAVGCFVKINDSVLLVKRGHPPNEDLWAIPGGKVEFGETLQEALKREMKEETGLDVNVKDLIALVEIIHKNYHYVILDFECEPIGGKLLASSDAKEVKLIPLKELEKVKMTDTTYDMLKRYVNNEKKPYYITQISK